jgi:glycogen(starch) synthase
MYATAAIYAATSCYEPFGLSALEAALSRCALVMNDNPVFRELWADRAVYFKKDDPEDLARVIAELRSDPAIQASYADRAYMRACDKFTAAQMVAEYEKVYSETAAHVSVS